MFKPYRKSTNIKCRNLENSTNEISGSNGKNVSKTVIPNSTNEKLCNVQKNVSKTVSRIIKQKTFGKFS